MKTPYLFFFLLLILVGGSFWLIGDRGKVDKENFLTPQENLSATATRTDLGEGGVTVTVEWERGESRMPLSFNTHTFDDLSNFDVKNNVVLKTDNKEILPVAWQENPSSGHHRGGSLVFPQAPQGKFQIVIKNLAGIPERILDFSP